MRVRIRYFVFVLCFVINGAMWLSSCGMVSDENDSPSTVEEAHENVVLSDIPEYSGTAFVTIEKNLPDFSEEEKGSIEAFEHYSELDSLRRCGVAYANVCKDIMPEMEREAIGQIRPSGWQTVKYNELIDGNYLYNRCHLIGYQLSGENANEKNLITGTRYLNVTGMLLFEDRIRDYVDDTQNHVLYRVTPHFEGSDLVASGIEMEGWSVEDEGAGVCFHVYCYNVQPGIGIDYFDGDSWVAETKGDGVSEGTQETEFVINTNTGKFHLISCSSVEDIAKHNRHDIVGTVTEIADQGYEPCQRCLGNG